MNDSMIQDREVQKISNRLEGKSIALGVCGGIASTEAIKIIREFRRHGALVTVFMTPDATRFITPLALEWASHRKVVGAPGPEVEYLESYDCVVVAPATLNTLSKLAAGITETSVGLVSASQLGQKKPLVFVPTMNDSLLRFPGYEVARLTLQKWGAVFLEGDSEEGRLKIPSPEKIVAHVLESLK